MTLFVQHFLPFTTAACTVHPRYVSVRFLPFISAFFLSLSPRGHEWLHQWTVVIGVLFISLINAK